MKYTLLTLLCVIALFTACQDQSAETSPEQIDTTAAFDDDDHIPDTLDVYTGGRFRNVQVHKLGDSTFEIKGEAQVFEAAFSWVVEDGERQLKQGHATASIGAPEWGKFSFEVTAAKNAPESVPQLILFEPSAKDGSRQNELPILLYR